MRRPLRRSRPASSRSKREGIASPGLREMATDSRGLLSFQQQRILRSEQARSDRVQLPRRRSECVCPDRSILTSLEASIATICERHEVLRSIFFERLGEPMQMVTNSSAAPRTPRPATVRRAQARRRRFNRRHRNYCANLSTLKGSRPYGRSY